MVLRCESMNNWYGYSLIPLKLLFLYVEHDLSLMLPSSPLISRVLMEMRFLSLERMVLMTSSSVKPVDWIGLF